MACTTVECADCAKEYNVQMYGPTKTRQWRVDHWSGLCDGCTEKKKEAASEAAVAYATEADLPALQGTEKQIKWAEVLRAKRMQEVDKMIEDAKTPMSDRGQRILNHLYEQSDARLWIDTRMESLDWVIRKIANSCPAETRVANVEKEAKADATIRPTTPKTETIAEISSVGNSVLVRFPEKRQDFWELIKKEMDYRWNGNAWVLNINTVTGPVEERIVEAGVRILAGGFCIMVHDASLRQRIIIGDYNMAPKCWVSKLTTGKYQGWFSIRWKKGDWYHEAKRLPASKWDKDSSSVVVPPEQFEELLGFAGHNEFALSDGAQELAEQARIKRQTAIVADIELTKTETATPGHRKILHPNDAGTVDPALID